jgi:chromosome segregation ATPase
MPTRKVITLVVLAVGAGVLLRAQTPAATSSAGATNDAVAALVAEVRALRTDLSLVANASVRSQLLGTRIQLQEQRLMHLDRQRADIAAKLLEAERARAMFAQRLKGMEDPGAQVPAEHRREMELQAGRAKAELQAAQATETTLRAEHDTLLTALATEQSRWSDFNNRLDELERSLPRTGDR